ncbi:MAG: hypothetical protein ACI845_001753 [Gammaproteobacteria bacterium]|jgi:hypothetical protein
MRSPGLLSGVGFALAACVITAFLVFGLLLILPVLAPQLTVAIIAGCYLIYLLRYSATRHGYLTLFCAYGIITFGALLSNIPFYEFVLIEAGLIWIVRSLYLRTRVLHALIDLIIIICGLSVAGWALVQTRSLAVAVWCFYLVQALLFALPEHFIKPETKGNFTPNDQHRFNNAWQAAQSAVEKLSL